MDINNLCPHCMREIKDGKGEECPYCGKNPNLVNEVQHQLKPYTILQGKYLVGEVLGEGGFGITYMGFDINLEIRVAIKEFYPNGYATREANVTTMLTAYAGQSMEVVYKWRDNFLKEARSLAKCAHLSGVVGVKDFFQENNTAYIVQEYLEGQTLKEYAKSLGGKIPVEQLLSAIEPVMLSLGEVHKEGLIHRDISPDNIMLLKSGQMKLLDFGAARDYTESGEKSLSVLLKPGYAPEEQYRTKGNQGPWSDIYALAGTIYKCITGITPPEAMERMRQDEIQWPSQLGIAVAPNVEAALQKAMAVFAEDRYQTMEEFHKDLYTKTSEKVSQLVATPVQSVTPQNSSVSIQSTTQGQTEEQGQTVSTVTMQGDTNLYQQQVKENSGTVQQKLIEFVNGNKILVGALGGAFIVVLVLGVLLASSKSDTQLTEEPVAEVENSVEPESEPKVDIEADKMEEEQNIEETNANSMNVEAAVEKISKLYYEIEDNAEYLNFNAYVTNVAGYIDSNGELRKLVVDAAYDNGKYTKQFYYDNGQLFFAFFVAGAEELQFYYQNGELIRYIDEEGNIYDYGNLTDCESVGELVLGQSDDMLQIVSQDGYILPDSASRYLTQEDLLYLTAEELRLARNEIYARHGRVFKDEGLTAYFSTKHWYTPVVEEVSDTDLNEYEIANRDLIVSIEKGE